MINKIIFQVTLRDTRLFSMPVEAENVEEARNIAEDQFCRLSFRQIEPMFLCGDDCEILNVQQNDKTVWENS